MKKRKTRKWIAGSVLMVLFSGISMLFWYNEYVYSLPTPVPVNYHEVNNGETIEIRQYLNTNDDRPVFLHFFNPDCPCSRFNMPHFKSLVKMYGDKINFVVVVMSKDSGYRAESLQKKFNVAVPVLFDQSIAILCGVYSTPQAVILDQSNTLYYRGNYNKSRYCTDKNSNYAQIALELLLKHQPLTAFNRQALSAYGCTLPTCKK